MRKRSYSAPPTFSHRTSKKQKLDTDRNENTTSEKHDQNKAKSQNRADEAGPSHRDESDEWIIDGEIRQLLSNLSRIDPDFDPREAFRLVDIEQLRRSNLGPLYARGVRIELRDELGGARDIFKAEARLLAILALGMRKLIESVPDSKTKAQIVIRNPDLHRGALSTKWQVISDLSISEIIQLLMSALQSDESIDLSKTVFDLRYAVTTYGGWDRCQQFKYRQEDADTFARRKWSLIDPCPPAVKLRVTPEIYRKSCIPLSILIAKWIVDNPGKDSKKLHQFKTHKKPRIDMLEAMIKATGIGYGPHDPQVCNQILDYIGPGYQICLWVSEQPPKLRFGPDDAPKQLNIFLTQGHAYCIHKILAFLCSSHRGKSFCSLCKLSYLSNNPHICANAGCKSCSNAACLNRNTLEHRFLNERRCDSCGRRYYSDHCIKAHKKAKCGEGRDSLKLCPDCFLVALDKHICGSRKCDTCRTIQPFDHLCYVQKKVGGRRFEKPMSRVYYDIESYTDAKGVHWPCLLIAHIVSATGEFLDPPKIYEGFQCVDVFVEDLLKKNSIYADSYLLSHNNAGYDSYHLLNSLIAKNREIIGTFRNQDILSLEIKSNNILTRCTLQFLRCALSTMPKLFNKTDVAKGQFPYSLITPEHLQQPCYVGPEGERFPPKDLFDPELMKADSRPAFEKWWSEEKARFDADPSLRYVVRDELIKYCNDDCLVVKTCFEEMIRLSELKYPGVKLLKSLTLPSYVNALYCHSYMQENSIACLPGRGFCLERTSMECLGWLAYQRRKLGFVKLRHARSSLEVLIAGYKVDGYGVDRHGQTFVLEYNGCRYHGCVKCQPRTEEAEDAYARTMAKEKRLTFVANHPKKPFGAFKFVSTFGCEWKQMLQSNPELKRYTRHYLKSISDDCLDPRQSFRGGATNVNKHLVVANEGEEILYLDFTSMYPALCASRHGEEFPVGHPEVFLGLEIQERFGDDLEEAIKTEDMWGLVFCELHPAVRNKNPPIGVSINGKLMFCLCRTCAEQENQKTCTHTKDERKLVGTFLSIEIKAALSLPGDPYSIGRVWEVWHWPQSQRSTEVFKTFSLETYAEKEKCAGFPPHVKTVAEKQAYAQQLSEDLGVDIGPDEIVQNPSLKALAKFKINNFWGFWGRRCQRTHRCFAKTYAEFLAIEADETKEIISVEVCDNVIPIVYKDRFEPMSHKGSVVMASFVTAYGRLLLNKTLQEFPEAAIYTDTDSLILKLARGQKRPEMSGALGEWKNEIEAAYPGKGVRITRVSVAAPKSYSYDSELPDGTPLDPVVHIKGITKNSSAAHIFTPNVIEDVIRNRVSYSVPQMNFHRHIASQVITTNISQKEFRFSSNKRRILLDTPELDTVPYGYVDAVN